MALLSWQSHLECVPTRAFLSPLGRTHHSPLKAGRCPAEEGAPRPPRTACRLPASWRPAPSRSPSPARRVPTVPAPPPAPRPSQAWPRPRRPHAAFPPAFAPPPRPSHHPHAVLPAAAPRPTAATSQGLVTSWPGNSPAPKAGGAAPLRERETKLCEGPREAHTRPPQPQAATTPLGSGARPGP